jgi:hypothetical protein
MPTIYNGGQSPLEAAAIQARNSLIPINTYNYYADANKYSAIHTRALSDQTTPVYGKGSGEFLDINNYDGVGGQFDVIGTQTQAGSGRNQQITLNAVTWGYGPNQIAGSYYTQPNTSLNVGQVII